MSRSPRYGAVLLAIAAALAARPGHAQEGVPAAGRDYDLGSESWNGLSELGAIARARGFQIEARRELDWSELGPGDTLFVLYPTGRELAGPGGRTFMVSLDAVQLGSFIRQGGRVLLADDFGRADEALARLGILRRAAIGISPERLENGNPNLPVARPFDASHPLARGVEELVTNHPATFRVSAGPEVVFGFGSGEAVVVAGRMGTGRYVALSDPSVLINGMLAFDSNLRFALNLIDYLGQPGGGDLPATPPPGPRQAGRIVLLVGTFHVSGLPPDAIDAARSAGSVNELLGDFGRWLDELNDYLAPEPIMRLVGAAGALLLLVTVAFLSPFRKQREPDASFARLVGESSALERTLAEFDDERGDRNFAFPAAILREQVERWAESVAGTPAAEDHAALLRRVQRLPTRPELLPPGAFVSRREFVEIHDLAVAARSSVETP